MRQKWVLACPSFGECTARVKLELTDFSQIFIVLFFKNNVICYSFLENLEFTVLEFVNGQLNSEWIFEVFVSLKIPTRDYQYFCLW